MNLRNTLILAALLCSVEGASSQYAAQATAVNAVRAAGPASISAQSESTAAGKGIRVKWAAVTGAKYYNLYRNNVRIACTAAGVATFLDTSAELNKSYSYVVSAFVGDNVSNFSSSVSAQYTEMAAKAAPVVIAAPTQLTVNMEGGAAVGARLKWAAISNATWYRIFRDGKTIALVNTPTFLDTKVIPGGTYSYRISVIVITYESAQCDPVSITDVIPAVPQGLTSTPQWSSNCPRLRRHADGAYQAGLEVGDKRFLIQTVPQRKNCLRAV